MFARHSGLVRIAQSRHGWNNDETRLRENLFMKELRDMNFGLSVLDVSPVSSGSNSTRALHNTLDLAQLADRLGYKRYWLAEHHNLPSIASSAPEVMIGHVAS